MDKRISQQQSNNGSNNIGKQRKNPIAGFYNGFVCPFQSIGFVRQNKSLYKFIIFPLLINIFSFYLVLYFGLGVFQEMVMSRIPQGDAWYWLILNYFVILVAILVVMVFVFFSFAVIGNLIASPFNDVLSEKTELLLTGHQDNEPFTFGCFVKDASAALLVEVKKISVYLVGMLLLLLFHLLPLVGSMLYPALSISWTILFLIFEYTGYVFARKKIDFYGQRQIVKRHGTLMAGFGVGMFCLLAIPFLQFFCIPLGVVGAVRLLNGAGELSGEQCSTEGAMSMKS